MPDDKQNKIRINKITIENFKGIDHLELEFPKPKMDYEPDILVLGSKNGVGKTSVLQAISLLLLLFVVKILREESLVFPIDLSLHEKFNKFGKAGTENFKINSFIQINNVSNPMSLYATADIDRFLYDFNNCTDSMVELNNSTNNLINNFVQDTKESKEKLTKSLLGENIEPIILPTFLFFHSYRKISEGALSVSSDNGTHSSIFKEDMLKIILAKSGLYENIETEDAEKSYNQLNELFKQYADSTIDKLRSVPGNLSELRVRNLNSKSSYPFDNLSSGQKEIISMLYLIWKHTKDQPSIVLIDEPELHLNAEWQQKFIRTLHKLAPHNQYIFATHSKQIFSSVESYQRVILQPDQLNLDTLNNENQK